MTQLLYNPNIEIKYLDDLGIMVCTWRGMQNEAMIVRSGGIIIECVKSLSVRRILNDNREVVGSWYEAGQWTAKEWFPALYAAGVNRFAWVLPEDIFAFISVKHARPELDGIKMFYHFDSAWEWIAQS